MNTIKDIVKIVKGTPIQDGAGVSLIRVVGHNDVREADPFLLLDAFDSNNPADNIRGFPMHPHRGIETVTYLIEGRIDHRDSLGNAGSIGAGQSQWMTAGSGILHEEMPQKSDRLFGLQLWVNLPRKDKMTSPQYFDITNEMIPMMPIKEGTVRVIAGAFGDAKGTQPRYVKATMLDISLSPDEQFSMPVDDEATVLIYILEGQGLFGPNGVHPVKNRTAAILGQGDTLSVRSGAQGLRFVLLAGRSLREPVAWGGSVVMNTQEELQAAFQDLEQGTFIK